MGKPIGVGSGATAGVCVKFNVVIDVLMRLFSVFDFLLHSSSRHLFITVSSVNCRWTGVGVDDDVGGVDDGVGAVDVAVNDVCSINGNVCAVNGSGGELPPFKVAS